MLESYLRVDEMRGECVVTRRGGVIFDALDLRHHDLPSHIHDDVDVKLYFSSPIDTLTLQVHNNMSLLKCHRR